MTIEPTPVEPVEHSHRSLELQREQYKDYSVHLERNLFDNPSQTMSQSPESSEALKSGRGHHQKDAVAAAKAALGSYQQPTQSFTHSSSAPRENIVMLLPDGEAERSISAHWKRRQQAVAVAWSERRRHSSSMNAKRSVNNAKLTRMGEALSFQNPQHVAVGAVPFGLSQPRMPRKSASDCAVSTYTAALSSQRLLIALCCSDTMLWVHCYRTYYYCCCYHRRRHLLTPGPRCIVMERTRT